jgi:aryl-alcohol dehydrogenase-like predicted oxidoreductase
LHEATLADASGEELLEVLQKQVDKGTIRHLGIASDFRKIENKETALPKQYEVIQFNDNVCNRNLARLMGHEERLLITHSVFVPAGKLREAVQTHPDITFEKSQRIGVDLRDPANIASLILHYALQSNPDGVVLFSSTNPAHVEANVREARAERFDGAQLAEFVRFVDEILRASGRSGDRVPGTAREIA